MTSSRGQAGKKLSPNVIQLYLWDLPLEKAIRERWKHFHEEDELLALPDG